MDRNQIQVLFYTTVDTLGEAGHDVEAMTPEMVIKKAFDLALLTLEEAKVLTNAYHFATDPEPIVPEQVLFGVENHKRIAEERRKSAPNVAIIEQHIRFTKKRLAQATGARKRALANGVTAAKRLQAMQQDVKPGMVLRGSTWVSI